MHAQRLAAYREKVSRALVDRFDLVLTVPRARSHEYDGAAGESSGAVRARIVAAAERLGDGPLPFDPAAEALLARAVDSLPLSGRGRTRVRRVAGTVAALAASGTVRAEHLAEALSYRTPTELRAG